MSRSYADQFPMPSDPAPGAPVILLEKDALGLRVSIDTTTANSQLRMTQVWTMQQRAAVLARALDEAIMNRASGKATSPIDVIVIMMGTDFLKELGKDIEKARDGR